MEQKIPKFLTRKENSLLFNGDGEFIFYVPEKFFETKNAVITGTKVEVLGMLTYTITDKKGNNNGLHNFKFPTMFYTEPTDIENLKDVKLTAFSDKQDFKMFKYKKNATVVSNIMVPQNVDNVEALYRLYIGGHIPNTIPYNELQDYFVKNININGASYGVSMQLIGMMLSEVCRSRKDLSVPFRLTKDKNMTNYTNIGIKEVPLQVSPYTAITSENWDRAVVSAINKGDDYKDTPMEKIMML